MRFAARSEVGLVRKVNQDGFLVRQEDSGAYVVSVADGMGGHVAGEVASSLALTTVWDALQSEPEERPAERLLAAIGAANRAIFEQSADNADYFGMGTTIVTVLAREDRLWVAHVGDSRAYLYRAQEGLVQLTEDHSLVNELVRRGQILPSEAANHPQRHMLTRALGTLPQVSAECKQWVWQAGDILLVCSDGLSTYVPEERLTSALAGDRELQGKVDALVQAALSAGGFDNITVVALAHDGEQGGGVQG